MSNSMPASSKLRTPPLHQPSSPNASAEPSNRMPNSRPGKLIRPMPNSVAAEAVLSEPRRHIRPSPTNLKPEQRRHEPGQRPSRLPAHPALSSADREPHP